MAEEITLRPPPDVRGMTQLDRERFQTTARVPCYVVGSSGPISKVLKVLKPCLLKMPKLRPVEEGKILLHPCKYKGIQFDKSDLCQENIAWVEVKLKYENWSSDDIFKAVLPEDSAGNVSSFSIVGHIIHLNLKAEMLEYRHLIGEVLLDKFQPNIRTVVNKLQSIDNTYRNFEMEHLAGESNYQVLVKENNCQYAFDYERVFWNPRLSNERDRMTNRVDSKDLICDVFAGVGPFAVPMAKKKCQVHANDLNPDSYHWLCHNAKLNKVDFETYNMDGKDFIQTVVKQTIVNYCNQKDDCIGDVHILMNLPAIALTFIKYFDGLLAGESVMFPKRLPIVHCYYFRKKDEEDLNVVKDYVSENVIEKAEISLVRVVAPNKYMMRITYELPRDFLFDEKSYEPLTKRIRLSTEDCNGGHLQNLKASSCS